MLKHIPTINNFPYEGNKLEEKSGFLSLPLCLNSSISYSSLLAKLDSKIF